MLIITSLFLLFGLSFCQEKFLVQVSKSAQENDIQLFSIEEFNNIKDEVSVGDLSIYIMEYNSFPYHLYLYDFVELVERDQEINLEKVSEETYERNIEITEVIDYNNFIFNVDISKNNKKMPEVKTQDKNYNLQENPVWNLDRVDERLNILNDKYYYPSTAGENVNVYIVDTGIDIKHTEFEGRALWGNNFVDNVNTDCNSHGTHVAGTVGSKTYGIAKKSTLIAVKVLNCKGSGSYSGVIAGMEYVVKAHKANNRTSVVNMSLGGPVSAVVNNAVKELTKNGIHVIVAAGNSNEDACKSSPSSERSAMSVGATTKNNQIASFSNWGTCVDILSPGTEIKSTVPNQGTAILQGTSMASPLVAGVYALVLSENPKFSPELMKKLMTTRCSKNYITGLKNGTVNCLVYSMP